MRHATWNDETIPYTFIGAWWDDFKITILKDKKYKINVAKMNKYKQLRQKEKQQIIKKVIYNYNCTMAQIGIDETTTNYMTIYGEITPHTYAYYLTFKDGEMAYAYKHFTPKQVFEIVEKTLTYLHTNYCKKWNITRTYTPKANWDNLPF